MVLRETLIVQLTVSAKILKRKQEQPAEYTLTSEQVRLSIS